jgi:protein involved in polysaccharide export with SLBB domain
MFHRIMKAAICLFFLFAGMTLSVHAQDLLKAADLSTVKVDNLSDADIMKFKTQMDAAGISMSNAEQQAIAKGMPASEAAKLRDRVSRLSFASGQKNDPSLDSQNVNRRAEKSSYKTVDQLPVSNVFGASFFTTSSLSFEPNLRIATPANYVLGPDDELVLNISGYQEANLRLKVQPEGTVNIPQVGLISVSGLTIDEATRRLKEKMSRAAYPNMSSGLTKLTVTLGNIRSIRITIIGAAKPANYTVSSLTTVFNSLYLCGGPGAINSYREIELRRGNKVIQKIDLYQLLTRGDESGNVLLKENDVINFPVYQKRITINGEVKRTGVFEMLEGETINDLLFFAGGFTDKAYTANIAIKQVTETERKVKDLAKKDFASYHLNNGDDIQVGAILERFQNSVSITGAVNRPGQFELTSGLTISGLIKKADGVREDVFLQRAILTRTYEDKHKGSIAFNISEVLNGGAADMPLYKGDEISVAAISDFINNYSVLIEGEVRKPGSFPYKEHLSLKDVLFAAGNFTDAAATYRIEISRRINADGAPTPSDSIAQVLNIETDKDLTQNGNNFILKPFDIIQVRKKPGYVEQQKVIISGEILYPGTYILQNKGERISSLLKRAGGLTPYAYPEGVFLIRNTKLSAFQQSDKIEKVQLLQKDINDTSSSAVEGVAKTNVKIPINIQAVLTQPGSHEDYVLEENDIVEISKLDPLVKITGEVFFATKTNFIPGMPLTYYLNKAGGTTENARRSKAYVLYPNGQVGKTHNGFLGLFRRSPVITTGSEIIVPRKAERKKLSTGEVVGLTATLVSLMSLIIVTINSIK